MDSRFVSRLNGLFLLLGFPMLVWGHDPGLSSAVITIKPASAELKLTFAKKDAEQLLESLAEPEIAHWDDEPRIHLSPFPSPLKLAASTGLGSGRGEGKSVTAWEFLKALGWLRLTERGAGTGALADWPRLRRTEKDRLQALVSAGFRIEWDHRPGVLQDFTISAPDQNNLTLACSLPVRAGSLLQVNCALLDRLPRGHRQYLSVQLENARPFAEKLLCAQDHAMEIAVPALDSSNATASSAGAFLRLGIKHILTGYDHLLFLFGLLIVTRRFAPALRIITCFTLAHSITLAIATLSPVPAPPRLVEPLIAASIVYVGLENLARGGEPKGRWLLTFVFGLIHGCGFASALRELGVGTSGGGIAVPLICFNSGVELGQLAIAALVLPLIWHLNRNPVFLKRFVPAASAAVVIFGSYWFVQRVWPG